MGGNPRRRRAEKRAGCDPWEGWPGQEMPSSFLGKKDPWPADWVSVGDRSTGRLGLASARTVQRLTAESERSRVKLETWPHRC